MSILARLGWRDERDPRDEKWPGARDVPIARDERRHLDVKAANEQLARSLFDAGVFAALDRCMRDVNTADAYFRIWVGAPNLRMQLATLTDDDAQRRLEAMKHVVALGTALARAAHRALSRGR
jgi:hypothetical protein